MLPVPVKILNGTFEQPIPGTWKILPKVQWWVKQIFSGVNEPKVERVLPACWPKVRLTSGYYGNVTTSRHLIYKCRPSVDRDRVMTTGSSCEPVGGSVIGPQSTGFSIWDPCLAFVVWYHQHLRIPTEGSLIHLRMSVDQTRNIRRRRCHTSV